MMVLKDRCSKWLVFKMLFKVPVPPKKSFSVFTTCICFTCTKRVKRKKCRQHGPYKVKLVERDKFLRTSWVIKSLEKKGTNWISLYLLKKFTYSLIFSKSFSLVPHSFLVEMISKYYEIFIAILLRSMKENWEWNNSLKHIFKTMVWFLPK